MSRVSSYYSRFQGFRGGVNDLPPWARFILFVLAIPGIVAIGLSIAAFLVSLLALLLLTVPAYRLLRAIAVGQEPQPVGSVEVVDPDAYSRGTAKHVDATVRAGELIDNIDQISGHEQNQ